jgi:hypothetical protein
MTHSCPVCAKTGIKDYRTNHVVCSQCNTDLKPYFLLTSIAQQGKKRKPKLLFGITAIASVVAVLSLFLYTIKGGSPSIAPPAKEVNFVAMKAYEEQIEKLKLQVQNQTKDDSVFLFKYTVRKGDNLSKLAKFFYGESKMYDQLEKDNDLNSPYILRPGQVLTIKLIKR